MSELIRVKSAKALEGYRVRLTLTNGEVKDVDVSPYLRGPVFEPLKNDMALFRRIRVESGTICWENGADIDPDVLCRGLKPAWMSESGAAA